MGKTRWLGISAGGLLAAALMAPVPASAVEFNYRNEVPGGEARGIAHHVHDWLYLGKNESRSATIEFNGGHEEELDVTLMENKTSGGEIYCSWRIKVKQNPGQSYCTILRSTFSPSRSCSGSVDYYPGTCAFWFLVK